MRSTLEFFNGNVNTILQVNTSGASGAEMAIRLTGTSALDADDFIL